MSAVVEGIVLVDEKAAPVPGALVSPIRQTPASVQAILGSRASSSVAPPTGWRTLRIRVQLLLAYGLLSLVAFGSLIGICAFITNNSADSVVSTSREELTKQVVNNSILMLGEAGLVLDARLQDGFSVLVQPTTFALYDILGGTSSLVPLPSYTETTVDHLKPPTSYEDRYHCVSTANDAVTGCGTDGLQLLSLTASSVYVVGSSLSGDGWGSADAAAWLAVNQTSVLDVFAKEAFGTRTAWVDTFVSGVTADPGPALFRQYPGAVGSLDATSDGTRTYDPSTRSWYTRVESAGALDATTTSEYLPQRPMYLSSPFLDQFGRGYLLTVAAPIVGPNGQVVGVSGADVLVSSLQSIVATIQSRATGEAFLVHRATGNVVASRQIDTSFEQRFRVQPRQAEWMVRWAAMAYNRYQQGHDGRTAYRRQNGRECHSEVLPFGEKVLFRQAKHTGARKNAMDSKWKHDTLKEKGSEMSRCCCFLLELLFLVQKSAHARVAVREPPGSHIIRTNPFASWGALVEHFINLTP